MRKFKQHKIMSQLKQSTKSKRISVKHFFSNEIIKKRSNSHIPIGETYMHRRLREVQSSQPNKFGVSPECLGPFGTVFGQLRPLFAFSVTTMCKISCFRWDGVHDNLSDVELSTWSKNISVQFLTFEN